MSLVCEKFLCIIYLSASGRAIILIIAPFPDKILRFVKLQKQQFFAAILLVFGVMVLVTGMLRGGSSINSYWDLRGSRDLLQQTINNLEKQNDNLQLEITKIKQSSDYAKKVLRDKYHVTEADESIVFFAD